tara:strand:- start:27 stop:395 length:369 start_codon:yes stop_codon:yes gene_type:complete
MGRLDHFVSKPPTTNLYKSLTNNGANMSKLETPSITSSRGYASSHLTWVKTMQKDMTTQVWGRIKDTGVNYIVEGWEVGVDVDITAWVQIPCANLATAQMYLSSVMDKVTFEMEKTNLPQCL